MVFNSFFGKRTIIREMLDNEKAEFLSTPWQRHLLGSFGPVLLGSFGWPVDFKARQRASILFGLLKGCRGSILDAGCAFGAHTFELARRLDCRVTGIDINEPNLRLAGRIKDILGAANVSFRHGDILENRFEDGEFDAVLMSQVIEHVRDDADLLREVCRILKDDGILVLSTDYAEITEDYAVPQLTSDNKADKEIPEGLFIGGGHWRNGYSRERLQTLMEASGFRVLAHDFVRVPSVLPETVMLFPLTYPVSLALRPYCGHKEDIIIKAQKVPRMAA